jgi:hypothetical protein
MEDDSEEKAAGTPGEKVAFVATVSEQTLRHHPPSADYFLFST